jgi:2-C-methyl-D-erythritol 2,4-cyclodiphosphate synthase
VSPDVRVGLGYDIHQVDPARPLVLAGVVLPGPGLAGHSDADAVAHAVADALLGPAGLGDLGSLYPASDDRYAGADSMQLLGDVVARVHDAGWEAVNVDVVVAAEAPPLAPYVDAMCAALRAVLGRGVRDPFVSLKPKRGEAVGAVGRREAIAVWAVALLERRRT